MKNKEIVPALLAGALAVLAAHRCAAQPVVINSCANSVTAGYVYLGNEMVESNASILPNFNALVETDASDDGSTSSASLLTSYRSGADYTFRGAGKVSFGGGVYDGNPSQAAGGQATAYAKITVNNAFNYQFVGNCHSANGVGDTLLFRLGEISGNQQRTEGGTLVAGTSFVIIGGCESSTNIGGSASFNYALQLTPSTAPPKFTGPQKNTFESSAAAQFEASAESLLQAQGAATDELAEKLLEISVAQVAAGESFYNQFLDPIDTNYTALAQVVFPAVTPLPAGNGITTLEAQYYNTWLTNLSQTAAYAVAWNVSVNRAQGADYSGSSSWSTTQMNAAAQFEAQLASLIDQEPALRSNVAAQFQSDNFPAITVTASVAANFQAQIATNGLPTNVLAGLTNLGMDGDDITNILSQFVTADPSTIAGSFPQSLSNTNLDSAQRALAGNFRDAALVLLNPAMLADGRFRFDLPTEPGYIYTIQFTPNPADPASWTTLITNNATTTLLSFTNTPQASARAGFYRATHQ